MQYEGSIQTSLEETLPAVSRYDTTDLFRDAVKTARLRIQQSLVGSERVGEAVRPKLTIDLSHKSIESIPDEVVDLLKKDVERYDLSK